MSSSLMWWPSAVELIEDPLGVDGVVEDDAVDDEPERAELFFLAFAVGLTQLALAAVEHLAGEVVSAFTAVELPNDRSPVGGVVAVVEQVHGLGGPADLGDPSAEGHEVAGVAA